MTKIDEARAIWQATANKFKEKRPVRVAYLGDGQGFATSNMIVPANPNYIFAREELSSRGAFAVLNKNTVRPAFNLPVYLGYTDEEPDFEQVLSINPHILEYTGSGSTLGGIGPHHIQHEFGGGDEVYIDGRLFTPGLLKPTTPISMQATVDAIYHYHKAWKRFPQTDTIDFTPYKPSSSSVFVLIALDQESNKLVYRPGDPFDPTGYTAPIDGGFAHVPAPAGNEMPLGAVLLASDTTEIDWNSARTNNLHDMRIHHAAATEEIWDRIHQLEGYLGTDPNIATTGAATHSTGKGIRTPTAESAYTVSNLTKDRTYDANSTTIGELADILGTLISDLKDNGILVYN